MPADKRQTARFVPARRTFFAIDRIYRKLGALTDISIGRASFDYLDNENNDTL
jgi:hypothetical protein